MPTTPRDGDVNCVNIFLLPCLAIQNPIWKSHQIGISSCTSNQSRWLLHSYLISCNNLASCRAQTGRNRTTMKVVFQLPPLLQIIRILKLIRSFFSHCLRMDAGVLSSRKEKSIKEKPSSCSQYSPSFLFFFSPGTVTCMIRAMKQIVSSVCVCTGSTKESVVLSINDSSAAVRV